MARNEELRVSLVSKKDSSAPVALPLESITPNRAYVSLRPDGELKQIMFYNAKRQRVARMDFDHAHLGIKPHVQIDGADDLARALNILEREYIRKVLQWLATLR